MPRATDRQRRAGAAIQSTETLSFSLPGSVVDADGGQTGFSLRRSIRRSAHARVILDSTLITLTA
jgi:hypothetical protein